ncbi:hypothetical protein NGB36_32475 [Streptomyces sp. RB6PN25]|uniref:Uncharacterized protein n=1 Tax=Streptomyces humicola TaxID=2953240 RepID=A0ABT1Q5F7_9ACTN|nr:hypothetical protein [Streptomyces humicola]MCQ4085152.1 hypothetical protein [Streptomyces humicola]
MRKSHLLVVATSATVVFIGAAPAFAGTGTGQVIVSPSMASPGQMVNVSGTCPNNGGSLQWVGSPAFAARSGDPYYAMTGKGGSAAMASTNPVNWSGRAMISQHAKPGKATVTARCGTVNIAVQIIVVNRGTTGTMPTPTRSGGMMMGSSMPSTMPSSMPSAMPSMTTATSQGQMGVMPSGAPDTGAVASGPSFPGGYAAEGAVGGVLLGAAGAAVFLLRRARVHR